MNYILKKIFYKKKIMRKMFSFPHNPFSFIFLLKVKSGLIY